MSLPTIGIIGGGQLARMMALAAAPIGLPTRVLVASAEDSAATVAPTFLGNSADFAELFDFARSVDIVTFDHENVPSEHLHRLEAEGVTLRPQAQALQVAQDKLLMRKTLAKLAVPQPLWAAVRSIDELTGFAEKTGWPIVLKRPRGGYDGKGVRLLDTATEAHDCADWFATTQGPLLVEEKVDFLRELSVLVARGPDEALAFWDIVESVQRRGVCEEVVAPAPALVPDTVRAIQNTAQSLATRLSVVGVLAVEIFETPMGFCVNELAMRPHNTGHWSMDGTITGQFEQHMRAVAGLPLGSTQRLAEHVIMKNILGARHFDQVLPAALKIEPEAHIHHYGKSFRPGRKMGHVTVLSRTGESLDSAHSRADAVLATLHTETTTHDRTS